MSDKKWLIDNNQYSYNNIPTVKDKLPFGIYDLKYSDMIGFYLDKISDKFELPEKIYDIEDELIDRIKTTFNGFNKNFGVLLKGTKGTGKTIVAKTVSNELQLPVICINRNYGHIGSFINSINQDIVLLFDEFEKVYELSSYVRDGDDDENPNNNKTGVSALLTLMDGVFTSNNKRLFLLTTNKNYMPDALMSRPSRIRYVKEFKDLSLETIKLIFDDIVTNKDLIPGLMDLTKNLDIITVDIIKAIAEEANMYNTNDPEFFSIFNLTRKENKNYLVLHDSNGKEVGRTITNRINLSYYCTGENIRFGRKIYIIINSTTDEDISELEMVELLDKKDSKGNKVLGKEKYTLTVESVEDLHEAFNVKYAYDF